MTTTTDYTTGRAAQTARTYGISPWRGVQLIAAREISMSLRSKAFIISFLITLVAIIGGIVVTSIIGERGGIGGPPKVAVSQAAEGALSPDAFEITDAGSATQALDRVRAGDADAAVVAASELEGVETYTPDGDPVDLAGFEGLVVVSESSLDETVIGALTVAPPTVLLEQSEVPAWLGYALSFAFGIVFFMASIMYCSAIAQSVVEEKQTRIVEILLATVTPRVLMFGKILGNAALALGQIAIIAVAAMATISITGQGDLFTQIAPALAWFVALYTVGFVLLASLYAGAAALVSRQEDVASATSPLMFLIMIPYFLVIFGNQNPTLMMIMSFVPFSAPVAMPVRVILGAAAWWEPLVALAVLIATTYVCILIGARLYERSILRIGAPVKLSEALRG